VAVVAAAAAALLAAAVLPAAGARAATTPRIIDGQVHGAWGITDGGSVVVVRFRASGLPDGARLTIRCLPG
jgi:hypothetical protein